MKNNVTVGHRRDLLKLASSALTVAALPASGLALDITKTPESSGRPGGFFDVSKFGATGDGKTLDTAAIHAAIQAAVDVGGGTVYFPAGTYASYSIRLRNHIGLYLDEGATLLAADTPLEGTTTGGYDAAEPQGPWEPYQIKGTTIGTTA